MKRILLSFLVLVLGLSLYAQLEQEFQIFYDVDHSKIIIKESLKLEAFLDSIQQQEIISVAVAAYCDDVASTDYNQTLSEQRAQVVADYLKERIAIPNLSYTIEGLGEIPLNGNENIEEQRANNRRSEITFTLEKPELQYLDSTIRLDIIKKDDKTGKVFIDLKKMEVGDKIVLEDLHFKPNTPLILKKSHPTLRALLRALKENPDYQIKLIGHVSCPECEDNLHEIYWEGVELSQARVEKISNDLLRYGITWDRLTFEGVKWHQPSGKGPKYDKRIELEITQK